MSTTLHKNRNLQSKCLHISKFKHPIVRSVSADNALSMKFTLSSNKQAQEDVLPIIEESAPEMGNKRMSLEIRADSANLALLREDNYPRADVNKLKSLQTIIDSVQEEGSGLWPRRNFQFFRKDFLRITKINPSDLYCFKTKLGEGAQGTVYQSIDRRTREERAIKVIHKESVRNQQDFFA